MPARTVNNISGASRKRSRRDESVAADDDVDEDELVDVRQASSQLRSEPVCFAVPPHSVNVTRLVSEHDPWHMAQIYSQLT